MAKNLDKESFENTVDVEITQESEPSVDVEFWQKESGLKQVELEIIKKEHPNNIDLELWQDEKEIINVEITNGQYSPQGVVHDDTLKGSGVKSDPFGVADAVLQNIESRVEKTSEPDKIYGTDSQGKQTVYDKDSFGKVDDVFVDGESVVENKIARIDLTGKVDKVSTANRVYGTDGQGNQTTYDKNDFGKVDDVKVNGVSVVENKIANVTVPTKTSEITNDSGFITKSVDNLDNYTKTSDLSNVALTGDYEDLKNTPTNVSDFTNDADYQNGTQVSNTVESGINTHNTSNNAHSNLLTPIKQDITSIEEKIPAEASSSNQLADKAYVDGKIGDVNEWTTEQYTPTTTNFVVGNTYTVEEAFQRTASLFAGQQGEIDDIEEVIPTQATAQNQLADKNFVNATVATNSANFRGNWATWTDVPTDASLYPEDYVGNRTPTNNDYMVVSDASDYTAEGMEIKIYWDGWGTHRFSVNDSALVAIGGVNEWVPFNLENDVIIYIKDYEPSYGRFGIKCNVDMLVDGSIVPAGNVVQFIESQASRTLYYYTASSSDFSGQWRFLYIGDWSTFGKAGWKPSYRIGTAFTQEQQAAIDSGITKNMVDNYVNPNSTAATAYNSRITALETDKRDIINSANKVYATDNNGANKNDLVYDKTATAETIAQRGTNGVLKVGTPVDNADATTKQYVDTIASAKQDTLVSGTNIKTINNESLLGDGNITISNKINTYVFDMATASDLWTIEHNLDKYPSVSVVDSGGNIVCGIVHYIDKNSLTIEFNGAFTGKAYLN